MVRFGGPGVMVLAILLTGFVTLALTLVIGRRAGWAVTILWAAFAWTLTAVLVVTLLPANGPPGIIPIELAQTSCSFDYGGPAPDGFWIFGGGQRVLNVAVFVPASFFGTLALSRTRRGLRWLFPGVIVLAGCSVGIEATQLELARIGRACDVTDIVDNTTGVLLGTAIGLVVAGVTRLVTRGHALGSER